MRFLILLSTVAASLSFISSRAQATPELDAATRCDAMTSADFAAIQDAPTQVIAAKLIPAVGDVPAYCDARGYSAPQVGIALKLPSEDWNGKLLMVGCGGWCGGFMGGYSENPGHGCDQVLRKGYACLDTDQGHQSTFLDLKWAYNNLQAQIDYAIRATHVALLAGKAITAHYYVKAPSKSYFWGCSGGGRQGMVAAQRFPWDFDGIVVVAPSFMSVDHSGVNWLWNSRVAKQNGKPLFSPEDLKWLQAEVIARCDSNDGVKDGVIGNPPACKVDPSEWSCKPEKTARCLSATQAEAFAKIYAGPQNSQGQHIDVARVSNVEAVIANVPTTVEPPSQVVDFFRYMGFMPAPGPGWQLSDFDFDKDYKRMAISQAILADANPDLRKFKAAGGKLILAHGWSDGSLPQKTIDYYEMTERAMGGREVTQDFFRLFMVPGMGHCYGGDGAYAIDYLSYLEDWTEKGQAPDVMIGAKPREGVWTGWDFKFPANPTDMMFTRPMYPYPFWAKYRGRGDPNDASNFDLVRP